MTYANRRAIPYVVLVGDTEVKEAKYTLKNMNSGTQQTVDLEELIAQARLS